MSIYHEDGLTSGSPRPLSWFNIWRTFLGLPSKWAFLKHLGFVLGVWIPFLWFVMISPGCGHKRFGHQGSPRPAVPNLVERCIILKGFVGPLIPMIFWSILSPCLGAIFMSAFHMATAEDQHEGSKEMQCIPKKYLIQTPNIHKIALKRWSGRPAKESYSK